MPCRPAEDDPSLNPGHGWQAADLLIWACGELGRDPPIWAYLLQRNRMSLDHRPTRALCRMLRDLTPQQWQRLMAAGDRRQAERLEWWWHEHRRADAERDRAGGQGND